MSGKRRKNAGEGYGYMFSGAFSEKKDAVAKEKKRKGSFIKGMPTRHGYRYVVMTPRTNPIKRKKKQLCGVNFSYGMGGDQYCTLPKGHKGPHRQDRAANPSELIVMGANPHEGTHEIHAKQGDTITIRVNPASLVHNASSGDDTQWMLLALAELFPTAHLATLTATQLSKVAMLAAVLKHKQNEPRENIYWGFGASHPSKHELVQSRREHRARVRAEAARLREQYQRFRKSARGSFKDKKKLETLFHEVYGQNPAVCGAMIGGLPCTRQPGHRGPHLPQGATLRPRSRHSWGPRGNPSAESLRERFTGAPVERVQIFDEPHMPAGDYAKIGNLLSPGLYIKPLHGGQVMHISGHGIRVVSDERAQAEQGKLGPLWLVGGDQDISDGLHMFGARERGNGIFELGELRRIDYRQRKEHVEDPSSDRWRHEMGEETGVRPMVLFDANMKRILLEGGDYRIEDVGIVN